MRERAAIVVLAMLAAGCVTPPPKASPQVRASAPVGAPYDPTVPRDAPWPAASWWKAFGDPQLDALIAKGLAGAPGLATAQARVAAGDAAVARELAQTGVRLSSSAGYSRQRISDNGLISGRLLNVSWYNQADAALGLDVDFDWWGRQKAGIAAAMNRGRAAQAEGRAAELYLASGIASTYLGWQSDNARIDLARQAVAAVEQSRRLQAQRVAQGIDAPDTLDRIDAELGQAREAVTLLTGSIYNRRLTLAALLGVAPAEVDLSKPGRANVPFQTQPPDASLGLIARRPDLVASRWRVEGAVQDVAQARAGFYPDISLSALGGLSSTQVSDFFDSGSRVAKLGVSVYLPIFDSRGVKARHGVQRASMELAVASYNEQVVSAAHEVAYEVAAWTGLSERRQNAVTRLNAAQSAQKATLARGASGVDDARAELAASVEVLRMRDALVALDGDIALSRIALIKALGGGFVPGGAPAPAQTVARQ